MTRGSFNSRRACFDQWPVRSLNRLDAARPMEIRDLESLARASSLRSDATAHSQKYNFTYVRGPAAFHLESTSLARNSLHDQNTGLDICTHLLAYRK